MSLRSSLTILSFRLLTSSSAKKEFNNDPKLFYCQLLAAITLTTWLDVIAMKTDAAKEISFDDEHQCGEAKDLFFTPSLRCLHLKIEFLKKAQDFKFWGRNGSKQRVIAMDTLHKYCEESFGLTGNDDKLFEKMWLEIHNLVGDLLKASYLKEVIFERIEFNFTPSVSHLVKKEKKKQNYNFCPQVPA